jgi:hypothetical protein
VDASFPFRLRGLEGLVTVTYGRNHDPERWGYGLLGLDWPQSLAKGLPVLRAVVSYAGEGYAAAMGWVQVVRIHVRETSEAMVAGVEKAPSGDHAWVDGAPQLRDLGVPFVAYGVLPTLFDAPASTESDVRFVADSFLTVAPDAVMSRVSRPYVGLRWGYETVKGTPELLPLTPLDSSHWLEAIPLLEGQFREWRFEPEWCD